MGHLWSLGGDRESHLQHLKINTKVCFWMHDVTLVEDKFLVAISIPNTYVLHGMIVLDRHYVVDLQYLEVHGFTFESRTPLFHVG